MRRTIFHWFVAIASIWSLVMPYLPGRVSGQVRTSTPQKHALLIGISTYDKHRGSDKDGYSIDWWNLHTENDISLLSDTLKSKKFGLTDIKILAQPEETTREQILKGMRDLIARTQEGDVVYIHYSGHGQPAPDASRPDGMVKTIVPSDYISQRDTSRNIRGPEIGELIDQLKAKKPSNITVSFDS